MTNGEGINYYSFFRVGMNFLKGKYFTKDRTYH